MRTLGFRSLLNKLLILSLSLTVTCSQSPGLYAAQTQGDSGLRLTVVEGQGTTHNVQRPAEQQIIVDVTGPNNSAVAGAVIGFLLPSSGPGGVFNNGINAFTVVTDTMGRAIARFTPNTVVGPFQIIITASFQGQSATTTISQTNVADNTSPAPAPRPVPRTGGGGGGMSGSTIALLVAAAAGAVALGVVVGGSGDSGPSGSPAPSPGQPTIRIGVGSGPSAGAPGWQSSVKPSTPLPKWRP
jgi:hypothetical protein